MRKIAIVGGGASGMMAAITAALHNVKVVLFEKNNRVGKKILATGNGRCNYTNTMATINDYQSGKADFAYAVLNTFTSQDTLSFFTSLGIEPKIETEGKVYPRSEQAASILDVLRYEIDRLNIEVKVSQDIRHIAITETGYGVAGINDFDAVIIATGGKAMPNSGSDGTGYRLAESFGHSVVLPKPALVQLKLAGDFFKAINGVKVEGIATLYKKDKVLLQDSGDILFTNYGISGPPILQISRIMARHSGKLRLVVNMYPEYSTSEMIELLKKRRKLEKSVVDGLIGLVNKRLIHTLLKKANIAFKTEMKSLSDKQIEVLATLLTAWSFDIIGTKGWQSAQVTVGGVSVNEVSPNTLASLCMPGIYYCGEVLDVDGRCGGYNLQWAWASGYVAGRSAAVGEL